MNDDTQDRPTPATPVLAALDAFMNDDTQDRPTLAAPVLAALDTFYTIYGEALPKLTKAQLQTILRRLDRYAHEVDNDMSRKQSPSAVKL